MRWWYLIEKVKELLKSVNRNHRHCKGKSGPVLCGPRCSVCVSVCVNLDCGCLRCFWHCWLDGRKGIWPVKKWVFEFYVFLSIKTMMMIYRPMKVRRPSWPRHCRKGVYSLCSSKGIQSVKDFVSAIAKGSSENLWAPDLTGRDLQFRIGQFNKSKNSRSNVNVVRYGGT